MTITSYPANAEPELASARREGGFSRKEAGQMKRLRAMIPTCPLETEGRFTCGAGRKYMTVEACRAGDQPFLSPLRRPGRRVPVSDWASHRWQMLMRVSVHVPGWPLSPTMPMTVTLTAGPYPSKSICSAAGDGLSCRRRAEWKWDNWRVCVNALSRSL